MGGSEAFCCSMLDFRKHYSHVFCLLFVPCFYKQLTSAGHDVLMDFPKASSIFRRPGAWAGAWLHWLHWLEASEALNAECLWKYSKSFSQIFWRYSGPTWSNHVESYLKFLQFSSSWRSFTMTLTSISCHLVDAIPSCSCVEGSGLVISF